MNIISNDIKLFRKKHFFFFYSWYKKSCISLIKLFSFFIPPWQKIFIPYMNTVKNVKVYFSYNDHRGLILNYVIWSFNDPEEELFCKHCGNWENVVHLQHLKKSHVIIFFFFLIHGPSVKPANHPAKSPNPITSHPFSPKTSRLTINLWQ